MNKNVRNLHIQINKIPSRNQNGAARPHLTQGGRKDGWGNEPVGSCAMCDARSTGPRALEGKNR